MDALAIACGTSHGAYKFSRKPDGEILAMAVIEEIHRRLPETHLVMHGSSSVPQELQDIINANGGEMPQTFGVPVEEIVRGIRHGVRKVNIDTDCRMAMTAEFRRVATADRREFDPRKFLKPAMAALTRLCRARFEAFGTAGQRAADPAAADGRDGAALCERQPRGGRLGGAGGVITRVRFPASGGNHMTSQNLSTIWQDIGRAGAAVPPGRRAGQRPARPAHPPARRALPFAPDATVERETQR